MSYGTASSHLPPRPNLPLESPCPPRTDGNSPLCSIGHHPLWVHCSKGSAATEDLPDPFEAASMAIQASFRSPYSCLWGTSSSSRAQAFEGPGATKRGPRGLTERAWGTNIRPKERVQASRGKEKRKRKNEEKTRLVMTE